MKSLVVVTVVILLALSTVACSDRGVEFYVKIGVRGTASQPQFQPQAPKAPAPKLKFAPTPCPTPAPTPCLESEASLPDADSRPINASIE
jgi:hypothetical protein